MTPARRTPSRGPGGSRPRPGASSSGRPRTGSARRSPGAATERPAEPAGGPGAGKPAGATATAGAAARPSGSSIRRPPSIGPGDTVEQRGRPSGRIAVVVLVLLVLVISYASSLRAWLAQRDEIDAARAELVQTREQVAAMEDDALRWKDPAYVASEARSRLGFVFPGETSYTVLDADGEPLVSSTTLDEPVTRGESAPATDWYSAVWGSVREAGRR